MTTVQKDDPWRIFYLQTKTVIEAYGAIVVYYVKAYEPEWRVLLEGRCEEWSAEEVMTEMNVQRKSLRAAGAQKEVFELAAVMEKMLRQEPVGEINRMRFHSVATELMKILPFYDVFPLDLDKKRSNREADKLKECGVFYSLWWKIDLPLRWFRYYADRYEEAVNGDLMDKGNRTTATEILNEALDRKNALADSDSDDDELHVRHIIGGEDKEKVIDSIKRKRKNRDEVQEKPSPDRTPNEAVSGTMPSTEEQPSSVASVEQQPSAVETPQTQ